MHGSTKLKQIKISCTAKNEMQRSVSPSLLCPSVYMTSRDEARCVMDNLVPKHSYLKRFCLFWQDSPYCSATLFGNSNDIKSHLFLPEAKFMGVCRLKQFFQLQVFCFCCLGAQNTLRVLLSLLVTPNFMCAVFVAWSTLNFKCRVFYLVNVLTFRYLGRLSSNTPPLSSTVFLFFELL